MNVEDVGGIPTHTFFLSNEGKGDRAGVPLVVVVPGSPGMGSFYMPFANKLFELGRGNLDVVVVSQAGHSPGHYKQPPSGSTHVTGQGAELSQTDWYTLQDQTVHKMAFIRERVLPGRPLILIGHSIGCWIILDMLKQLPSSRVVKIFLLFPAIEKMAETANNLSYYSMLWNSMRLPFTGMVWLATHLVPTVARSYLLHLRFSSSPLEHRSAMVEGVAGINEKSIYNITKMAFQEMEEVVEPLVDVIDSHIDKIVFYYGVNDKWNVETSYSDMAARYPGKEVHICPPHIAHAFVHTCSDEMANMVFSKF